MPESDYDFEYYAALRQGARRSADQVLPLVFDRLRPQTVVDFGCGSGGWLAAARGLGADIFGVDGPWVPREALEIDESQFLAADLSKPIDLEQEFDLALCVEVAEHLPVADARTLVESVTRHAPAVLFSAAIPGQGGTEHVNEAWPAFWFDYFAAADFVCFDVIRSKIWADPSVAPWYRQNLLLFIRRDAARAEQDRTSSDGGYRPPMSLVHPDMWCERLATVRRLETRVEDAQAEIVRLGSAWEAQAEEKAELEAELAEAKAWIAQLLGSRSWRLTAPLRRLDHLLRGRPR